MKKAILAYIEMGTVEVEDPVKAAIPSTRT